MPKAVTLPMSMSQVCLVRGVSSQGTSHGTHSLELNYDTFGDGQNPAVLLIMGLTSQKVRFPREFCEHLAAEGFFVIRFDNRDVGRSARAVKCRIRRLESLGLLLWGGLFRILKERSTPVIGLWVLFVVRAWKRGRLKSHLLKYLGLIAWIWVAKWYRPKVSYSVAELAGDALELLDALKVSKAHMVGYSMGGMISQFIAHHNPDRVLSLSLISTCSPNAKLLRRPGIIPMLRIAAKSKLCYIPGTPKSLRSQGTRDLWMQISSPGQEQVQRSLSCEEHSRGSQDLDAVVRQVLSIMDFCSGSEHWMPTQPEAKNHSTLVIHGLADNLLPVCHAFDLATQMNCKCVVLPSISHDSFPAGQWDIFEELKVHLCKPAVDRHPGCSSAAVW